MYELPKHGVEFIEGVYTTTLHMDFDNQLRLVVFPHYYKPPLNLPEDAVFPARSAAGSPAAPSTLGYGSAWSTATGGTGCGGGTSGGGSLCVLMWLGFFP